MLAGILVQFAVAVFQMAGAEPAFVLPLVALFLVARVVFPSMAPIAVLAGGVALGAATGRIGDVGGAMAEPKDRFAAVVTFAVTASGLGLLGIGAAFWGLAAGLATLGLERAAVARRG
jgi:benzoate membrane transport protein